MSPPGGVDHPVTNKPGRGSDRSSSRFGRVLGNTTFLLLLAVPVLSGQRGVQSRRAKGRAALTAQDACTPQPGRIARRISGEVSGGRAFEASAGRFVFRLTPERPAHGPSMGWDIGVFEPSRDEDLSRFTLPLRGPNARHLYAWHFRNADNSAANDGSTNAPGVHREFIFSPEVGRTIDYDEDAEKMLANVDRIEAFGRGTDRKSVV